MSLFMSTLLRMSSTCLVVDPKVRLEFNTFTK